jgi:hypothetical protein
MHEKNSFITLTFAPEHLPKDQSIRKEHLQKFFKRLRTRLADKFGYEYVHDETGELKKQQKVNIRYFACGEYGDLKNRPHYHAIIFGYDFPDKEVQTVHNGNVLYSSNELRDIWPYGWNIIGEVTFESAAYVARYVMKKMKAPRGNDLAQLDQQTKDRIQAYKENYEILDKETGEIFTIEPEFCLMSRRPGIGAEWFKRYYKDTEKDFVTINGVKVNLPRYYDQLTEKIDELLGRDDMMKRKHERIKKIDKEDNTSTRLRVKEKVKLAQTQTLSRNLEEI